MISPVYFCLVISISYDHIGNTLSQQSFHVFRCSIPENGILSVPVHPRAQLTSMEVPDAQ
jgi:hypothetical protein